MSHRLGRNRHKPTLYTLEIYKTYFILKIKWLKIINALIYFYSSDSRMR